MNIQGQYITKEGKRVNFRTQHYIDTDFGRMRQKQFLDLSFEDIVRLVLPDDIEEVYCRSNFITELVIPQSVKFISCNMMDGIERQCREGLKLSIWQATT